MKNVWLLACLLVIAYSSRGWAQLDTPCFGTVGMSQVPDPENCQAFYICIDGVGFPQQCGPGLIFDVITNNCNREEISVCIDEVATPPTPSG
ncbi:AAEL017266-PA [Aedes aegypti]|uniref:AAEL017266-PA n=1 Tax=Aedes aegypti TaxID=7159 RepID=J9HSN5_AEDAE|nr:AAEL017266-PA [Aedes aegypti]